MKMFCFLLKDTSAVSLHVFDELNVCTTTDEILNGINNLKTKRCGGPDGYQNECFIYGKAVLLPMLESLFNTNFEI